MRIKFNDSDPRAGQIVQMDSSRGEHFIAIGAAVEVKEGGQSAPATPEPTVDSRAAALLDQNATTVVAAIGKGVAADVLAAALAAERAQKDRKTVVEALEAAIATGGEG